MTLIFLGLSTSYLVNFIQWARGPVFGWTISNQMDKSILTTVYGPAAQSGLQAGDRIISVNGQPFYKMLELQKTLNREVGQTNVYLVSRSNEIFSVSVPNRALGFNNAFVQYGFTWLFGIVFFGLGAIVYIMKPGVRPSWVFLNMMFCLGLLITYSITSKLTPTILNLVVTFSLSFLPATVSQLTVTFPEERKRFADQKFIFWAPYVISLALFTAMVSTGTHPADVSPTLRTCTNLYLAYSLLLFLGVAAFTYFRSSSDIARVRSQVVLIGSAMAIVLPVSNLLSMQFLSYAFLPHPAFNLPFYLFFPLSIAFAIARHNLFDVDVYIKRTVGYTIMTLLVGSIYFSIQVGVKAVFSATAMGLYSEQIYPVIFAFLVVFFFNPVNSRIQAIVDRLFYRERFDYKDTVLTVSNALTTVFDLDKILKRIIYTLKREMFIDSAGVILLQPESEDCDTFFVHDLPDRKEEEVEETCLAQDDPLVALMLEEKKLVTVYDIEENPYFSSIRESVGSRFSALNATLALPLKYQDRITGVLALGHKKSGHFYSREDIELLETLANQGAIGIENAKMADQMKQEETVRANLARYLSPQIVEQVIHKDVEVNLGGARKEVTVLFSDIRQFTTITETRPPDELVAILNEYFTEMAKIIFENQGSLDKYIGDAIVAVFGSLIHLENPAQNAVCAAVDMMKKMPELNRKWAGQFDGFAMEIGIGINTGEVFLGNIGSPERMEFTVIGDTVNVASRFSDMAQPGQILATRATVKELGDEYDCISLPPSQVKGKSGELEVFGISYDVKSLE